MKKLWKIIGIVCTVVMLVCLTACGSSAVNQGADLNPDTPITTASQQERVDKSPDIEATEPAEEQYTSTAEPEVTEETEDGSIKGIDKAAEIEVVQYDRASGAEIGTVLLTEEAGIKHIVDNLNSLNLKKMEYTDPTILEYKLVFYDTNNEVIKTVSIPANEWVGFEGYYHSITSGELDRAYIAGLFE